MTRRLVLNLQQPAIDWFQLQYCEPLSGLPVVEVISIIVMEGKSGGFLLVAVSLVVRGSHVSRVSTVTVWQVPTTPWSRRARPCSIFYFQKKYTNENR